MSGRRGNPAMNPGIRPWFDSDYSAHVTASEYLAMMKWTSVHHDSTYIYPRQAKGIRHPVPEEPFAACDEVLE